MRIDADIIQNSSNSIGLSSSQNGEQSQSFGNLLMRSLERVNEMQVEADRQATALAAGQVENVHDVMLAGERAQLALQLTLTVRNKVVEAYQEISRMQI